MAEAQLRQIAGGRVVVFSAGTEAGQVHPLAIRSMAEAGIDLSGARSKHLEEFLEERFDDVVTVCDQANETCPIFPGAPERIHWSFPDASRAAGSEQERLDVFRATRDASAERLRAWLTTVPCGRSVRCCRDQRYLSSSTRLPSGSR
jgi:arsenate reductase